MGADKKSPNKEDLKLATLIWDYMNIDTQISKFPKCELIICLGSIDTLPAERSAELYKNKIGNKILFTGGSGLFFSDQGTYSTTTRALADVAVANGVPEVDILLEEKSTNTGDNIRFSSDLLKMRGLKVKNVAVTHMPSSLRRDFLTLLKQWPSPQPKFYMSSPHIKLDDYHIRGYGGKLSTKEIIGAMLGDFQRCFIYPKKGFMASIEQGCGQPASIETKDAYNELVELGYGGKHLLRDNSGKPIGI
jgi:hypothetical protein